MDSVNYTAIKLEAGKVSVLENGIPVIELEKITYGTDLSEFVYYVVCSDLGRPVIYGVRKGFPVLASGNKHISTTSRIASAMGAHDDLVLWDHVRIVDVSWVESTLCLSIPRNYGKPQELLKLSTDSARMDLIGVKIAFSLSEVPTDGSWIDEAMGALLWIGSSRFGYNKEIGTALVTIGNVVSQVNWEHYPTLKAMYDKYKRILG